MDGVSEEVESTMHTSSITIRSQLEQLCHEFDCLGLPNININVNVLEQLITSIYTLIRLYRKTISQNQELKLQETILKNEISSQKKALSISQDKIKLKENELMLQSELIKRKNYEIDDIKKIKDDLSKSLVSMKSLYNTREKEYINTYSRLKLENADLKEKLGLEIGNYKSKDSIMVEVMAKYKAKEAIYEDTINKLQDNNKQLMGDVLNLKEEILMALYNNSKT